MKFQLTALFLILIFISPALAEDNAVLKLSKSNSWLALGHYQKTLFGYKSYIDSKEFFLSKDGKFSPYKELKKTIELFEKSSESLDEHPVCKYPARYEFLKSKLKLNLAVTPNCKKFNEWYSLINPKGISLIFPTSFINNPASAFGHTFIRIDTENQTEKNSLLAYAANFSASTSGENAVTYALKGLFGGYDGYFSVTPYYKLVRTYSDLEKRDIWEYELNFTEKDASFIVKHLWELRKVSFIYYYLDENCSFHLLGLFEVVRPELKLRDSFKTWVIPIDTIKSIIVDKNLVTKEVFRPSVTTKFTEKLKNSTKDEIKLAKKIVRSEEFNFKAINSKYEKNFLARTYELAYDYLEFLMLSNKIDEKKGQKQSFTLLKERSKYDLVSKEVKVTPPVTPERMHESARFFSKFGNMDGKNYSEFAFRTPYHDLTDSDYGILSGSQIEFLETRVRRFHKEDFKLQELSVLNIASLSPRLSLVKPLSWRFNFGLKRRDDFKSAQKLIYKTDLLLGHTYNLNDKSFIFLLAGPDVNISRNLRNSYSFGPAFQAGVRYESSISRINLLSSFKVARHALGDEHTEVDFFNNIGLRISKNMSINLEYIRRRDYSRYYNNISFRFNLYF